MLCSVSTEQSGHGWLDRLRMARGFPDNEEADLGECLQNPPNRHATNRPEPKRNACQVFVLHRDEDESLFNIMSGVINELFNFGDKCNVSANFKKSARKQTNPKIYTSSSNRSRDSNNGTSEKVKLWNGDSSSGVEEVKELDDFENEEEGVDRDGSLAGFSRTDVTVIDTSYDVWKFEKLLYRKKNVWKVREKKGKSEILMNKKRKLSGGTGKNQEKGKKLKFDKEK